MAYYGRGDYYGVNRGDYYRGDPFIGGLIAGAARAILPRAGQLLGKAASWVTGGKLLGSGGGREALKTIAKVGATTAVAVPAIRAAVPMASSAMSTAGEWFGWDKPKRRRMNVTNVKALRRALRRAEGFEKIAQRTVSALHRGPRKFKKQSRAS